MKITVSKTEKPNVMGSNTSYLGTAIYSKQIKEIQDELAKMKRFTEFYEPISNILEIFGTEKLSNLLFESIDNYLCYYTDKSSNYDLEFDNYTYFSNFSIDCDSKYLYSIDENFYYNDVVLCFDVVNDYIQLQLSKIDTLMNREQTQFLIDYYLFLSELKFRLEYLHKSFYSLLQQSKIRNLHKDFNKQSNFEFVRNVEEIQNILEKKKDKKIA